jgi:hypothetical protein
MLNNFDLISFILGFASFPAIALLIFLALSIIVDGLADY